MAEDLQIIKGTKQEQYESLIPQVQALVEGENNLIANCANITAALKEQFNWLWTGFYFVENNETLVLGPFQGPVACTRIRKGKGVCGTAWAENKTIIVDNVDEFPGHIACSSISKSEIVIPVTVNDKIVAILDVDSKDYAAFDTTDAKFLEKIMQLPIGF